MAAFNALILGIGLGVGIVLLVVFSQIPLVLFSMLVSVAFAFVAPVSAVALTFLYGDAIAERSGLGSAQPVDTSVAIEGLPA